MMEHPCPLYTCKQSLLTEALSVGAHGPGGTWGGAILLRVREVYARSARNPLGEMWNWGMKAFLQRDYIVGVQRSEWCGRKYRRVAGIS
jgi:hypothetical protein